MLQRNIQALMAASMVLDRRKKQLPKVAFPKIAIAAATRRLKSLTKLQTLVSYAERPTNVVGRSPI